MPLCGRTLTVTSVPASTRQQNGRMPVHQCAYARRMLLLPHVRTLLGSTAAAGERYMPWAEDIP